ncbi:MAG: hypothetical protein SchgKO_06240 [Schleiferiaceae bacterium]
MKKHQAFFLILILGPVLGGLYGILHDQITYSLSEEYYTKFKFIQFGLQGWGADVSTDPNAPEIIMPQPRLGAAVVGFMATWWVGLFIGIILSLVGLIQKTGQQMWRITLRSFGWTLVIALTTGLLSYLYGITALAENPPDWRVPINTVDREAFIAVGSMHNFSYLGGLLGLIFAVIYQVVSKKRLARKTIY